MAKNISVVLPAHNEESSIAEVISALRRVTKYNLDIVVVDDGSKDATFAIATVKPFLDDGIRAFHIPPKPNGKSHGKAYAMVHGVAQAKFNTLFFLDSDLYNLQPYKVADALDEYFEKELDLAIGVFGKLKHAPLWLKTLNWMARKSQRLANNSGQRILSREKWNEFVQHCEALGVDLPTTEFGVEKWMNKAARDLKWHRDYFDLPRMTHRTKEQKYGLKAGGKSRGGMLGNLIASTLQQTRSIREFLKKITKDKKSPAQ